MINDFPVVEKKTLIKELAMFLISSASVMH